MKKRIFFILFFLLPLLALAVNAELKTCGEQGGVFCGPDQTCNGDYVFGVLDQEGGSVCCIGECTLTNEYKPSCGEITMLNVFDKAKCILLNLIYDLFDVVTTPMRAIIKYVLLEMEFEPKGIKWLWDISYWFVLTAFGVMVVVWGLTLIKAGFNPELVNQAKGQLIDFVLMFIMIIFSPFLVSVVLGFIKSISNLILGSSITQLGTALTASTVGLILLSTIFAVITAPLILAIFAYFAYAVVVRIIMVYLLLSILPVIIALYFFYPTKQMGKKMLTMLGANMIVPIFWALVFVVPLHIPGIWGILGYVIILATLPLNASLYFKFASPPMSLFAIPSGVKSFVKGTEKTAGEIKKQVVRPSLYEEQRRIYHQREVAAKTAAQRTVPPSLRTAASRAAAKPPVQQPQVVVTESGTGFLRVPEAGAQERIKQGIEPKYENIPIQPKGYVFTRADKRTAIMRKLSGMNVREIEAMALNNIYSDGTEKVKGAAVVYAAARRSRSKNLSEAEKKDWQIKLTQNLGKISYTQLDDMYKEHANIEDKNIKEKYNINGR